MNYRLAQIILAARNEDAEGWMNTLVIVLLAVFWAIGGILKARARKAEAAEEAEEEDGKKPFRPTARRAIATPKARGIQVSPSRIASAERGMYKDRGVAVQRPQPRRIQASAETLAVGIEPRQAKPSVTVRKGRGPETAVAKVTSEWAKKPEFVPEEPAIEPLLSAEEPDELRRAILHYEILGKPLSLREPMDEGR